MKRICWSLVYVAAALFLLAALAVGTPHQKKPITLTLQAPKQPLKAGDPLTMRLTVANAMDRPVDVPISRGSINVGKIYRVRVLDERGRSVPRRPHPLSRGKGTFLVPGGSIAGTSLGPGESVMDRVNVTYLYDLTRPGKYKIWIGEPFYRGPDVPNGLVQSNTVTVIVVK